MISADKPRLSSTVCQALRLAAGADCFQRAVILSVLTLLCHWGFFYVETDPQGFAAGQPKAQEHGRSCSAVFFLNIAMTNSDNSSILFFLFFPKSQHFKQTMVKKHRAVHCFFYTNIYLESEEKQIITWLPCKLLHVPETNNEQENVVGESFLDIYRNKNEQACD